MRINDLIVKHKNMEEEDFDKEELLSTINELLSDEDYEEKLSDIEYYLQYTITEYNDTKGEVSEKYYCKEKVKVVLEEIPNILFLKFYPMDGCSTFIDFIIYKRDYDNFELVLKILEKNKIDIYDMLKDCNEYTSEQVILYLEKKNNLL
jgi:hypothetical protein